MGHPIHMFWKDREGYENFFFGREEKLAPDVVLNIQSNSS